MPGLYIGEDFKAAALDTMDFAGREIDFHGLRNSLISCLVNSGTPFKVVQTLARHSEPKLTYNVYARTFKETERKAVAGLPVIDIANLGVNKIISAFQDAENGGAYFANCLTKSMSPIRSLPESTGILEQTQKGEESPSKPKKIDSSIVNPTAGGGTRTLTLLPGRDFESRASANSATPAHLAYYQLFVIYY